MDSFANDFRTALTLKVPTTSISAHFSSDSDHKSDSSSVGDRFGSQGGSEGRKHAVPKISIGILDSDQTATSQSSRSSNKISLGMSQSIKSSSSQTDMLSKGNKKKTPQIAVIGHDEEEIKEGQQQMQDDEPDEYFNSLPTISMSELQKHNTPNDFWTAVDGLVYNVTLFAPQHPGGKVIFQGAGKESSKIFHKSHGPLELKDTPVSKCCIGRLCMTDEEQTYVAPEPNQKYANKQYLDIF